MSYLANDKPVNLHRLRQMYESGEKIATLTSYDASFAALVERCGVQEVLDGREHAGGPGGAVGRAWRGPHADGPPPAASRSPAASPSLQNPSLLPAPQPAQLLGPNMFWQCLSVCAVGWIHIATGIQVIANLNSRDM